MKSHFVLPCNMECLKGTVYDGKGETVSQLHLISYRNTVFYEDSNSLLCLEPTCSSTWFQGLSGTYVVQRAIAGPLQKEVLLLETCLTPHRKQSSHTAKVEPYLHGCYI